MSTIISWLKRKPTRSKFFVLLPVTLCVVAAGVLILKPRLSAWFAPSITRPNKLIVSDVSTAQLQVRSDATPLQAELITLRPTGFEPAHIKPSKGRFLLVVNNHSELASVELLLHRETGSRLHAVRVSQEQLSWSEAVDLQPGRYVLTEANHRDWVCRITVASP